MNKKDNSVKTLSFSQCCGSGSGGSMFLGLPDPDLLVRDTDSDLLVRDTDPDPSIIKQK
jgi:hypothetical protein